MQHNLFDWSPNPATIATAAVKKTENLEAKEVRRVFAPYSPPRTMRGEVYAQIIRDIDFIRERFVRLEQKAVGYSDSMEATSEELAEMFLSIGSTASLVSYRLPGFPWRLDICSQKTPDGKRIVDQLDALRDVLLANERNIIAVMKRSETKRFIKRSLALCVLSLDAASDFSRIEYLAFAGLCPSTRDPVGDAQDACETHDLDGTIPLFNA